MDLPSVLGGVSAVGLLSMNIRHLALSCLALFLGCCQQLVAADAAAATKPGYNILIEVSFDEAGATEDAKIIESDDFSGDMILNQIALSLCKELKQAPKLKEGKPVKFKARVPFNFPVEDDEGAAANNGPKPALNSEETSHLRPAFPQNLAAKGENGGAILELIIGSFGNVQSAKVLRASHQEYADSAVAAVKTWIFMPAQKDGVNVESRWRIAIGFVANGKELDWKWRIAPRPSLGGYMVVHAKPAADAPAAPAVAPVPAK